MQLNFFRNTWTCLILSSLVSSPLFAHINLIDNLAHAYIAGPRERLGIHTLSFEGDDFPLASAANPYFLKFTFPNHNIRLQQTLVDPADPQLDLPIFLPLFLYSTANSSSLAALADAISIIRWVAGEDAIWIRIQASTSTWVTRNGMPSAPSSQDKVELILGLSARHYSEIAADQDHQLPFPTRVLDTSDPAHAESLLLIADLSQSQGLSTTGPQNGLNYDVVFFDSSAQLAPGVFRDTQPWLVSLSGGVQSAFLYDWGSSGRFTSERLAPAAPLTPVEFSASIHFSNREVLVAFPESLVLQPGSRLRLELDPHTKLGFPPSAAAFALNGQPEGSLWLDPESEFEHQGQRLYRTLELSWTGEPLSVADLTLPLRVRLVATATIDPAQTTLRYRLAQTNRESWLDVAPYDALNQAREAEPYAHILSEGLWRPFANPNSQHLPHITRADGGFSTAITLFHGASTEQTARLQPYGEDGQALTPRTIALGASQTQELSSAELFHGEDVASLEILEPSESLHVLALFRARQAEAVPAHSPAKSHAFRRWRLYPSLTEQSWDGLAAINLGAVTTTLQISAFSANGSRLCVETVGQLHPQAKLLQLLPDCQEEGVAYFEIESDEPLVITALRGDTSHRYLWENPAVALP